MPAQSWLWRGGRRNPASSCGQAISANAAEEQLLLAGKHARKDQGVEPTPELLAPVQSHIKDCRAFWNTGPVALSARLR